MTVLVDTGALYALADQRDSWHVRMREWLLRNREPVLVPVTVLPEAAYLIGTRLGNSVEEAFVRSLATGALPVEPLDDEDMARAADLIGTYSDLPLGFVDASIVAMAERKGIGSIATTDRRHFGVVRPSHVERLRLLP